jgi:hypothetical protein
MNFIELAKMLAEAEEQDCMRAMTYIVIRLEYLHKQEHLKRCGYVEEVAP